MLPNPCVGEYVSDDAVRDGILTRNRQLLRDKEALLGEKERLKSWVKALAVKYHSFRHTRKCFEDCNMSYCVEVRSMLNE